MPKWQHQYESDRKYLPVWEQTFSYYINSDVLIEGFQIGVVSRSWVDHGVQLRSQVPSTSPVGHRDQQHYVYCENSLLVQNSSVILPNWLIP